MSNAQNIFSEEYATPILDIVAKKCDLTKIFRTDGANKKKQKIFKSAEEYL